MFGWMFIVNYLSPQALISLIRVNRRMYTWGMSEHTLRTIFAMYDITELETIRSGLKYILKYSTYIHPICTPYLLRDLQNDYVLDIFDQLWYLGWRRYKRIWINVDTLYPLNKEQCVALQRQSNQKYTLGLFHTGNMWGNYIPDVDEVKILLDRVFFHQADDWYILSYNRIYRASELILPYSGITKIAEDHDWLLDKYGRLFHNYQLILENIKNFWSNDVRTWSENRKIYYLTNHDGLYLYQESGSTLLSENVVQVICTQYELYYRLRSGEVYDVMNIESPIFHQVTAMTICANRMYYAIDKQIYVQGKIVNGCKFSQPVTSLKIKVGHNEVEYCLVSHD